MRVSIPYSRDKDARPARNLDLTQREPFTPNRDSQRDATRLTQKRLVVVSTVQLSQNNLYRQHAGQIMQDCLGKGISESSLDTLLANGARVVAASAWSAPVEYLPQSLNPAIYATCTGTTYIVEATRETLGNPLRPRDNSPVLSGQD
jgi:hypothetical protein